VNRNQVIELVRVADPMSEKSSESDGFPSQTALLDRIDERSTNVQAQQKTQTIPSPPSPGGRRRWLIPAFAGGAAVAIAIVLMVAVFDSSDGNSDDQDGAVAATTASTTVPEPAALSPLEVVEALNEAVRTGDWKAERRMFADDATHTNLAAIQAGMANAADNAPFSDPSVLYFSDTLFTEFDWDGDGTKSLFDGVASDTMSLYSMGVTTLYSCSETDSTTVSCAIRMEGNPFLAGSFLTGATSTFTIENGLITHEAFDPFGDPHVGEKEVAYHEWVRATHPDLNPDDSLFEFFGKPLIDPDTVETHRRLIAEWKAQR